MGDPDAGRSRGREGKREGGIVGEWRGRGIGRGTGKKEKRCRGNGGRGGDSKWGRRERRRGSWGSVIRPGSRRYFSRERSGRGRWVAAGRRLVTRDGGGYSAHGDGTACTLGRSLCLWEEAKPCFDFWFRNSVLGLYARLLRLGVSTCSDVDFWRSRPRTGREITVSRECRERRSSSDPPRAPHLKYLT